MTITSLKTTLTAHVEKMQAELSRLTKPYVVFVDSAYEGVAYKVEHKGIYLHILPCSLVDATRYPATGRTRNDVLLKLEEKGLTVKAVSLRLALAEKIIETKQMIASLDTI